MIVRITPVNERERERERERENYVYYRKHTPTSILTGNQIINGRQRKHSVPYRADHRELL